MKKVVIIGPECTGKSTLAHALANKCNSPWIPEYARTYVEQLSHPYTYEDVETIAKHQIHELKTYVEKFSTKPYLFIDTDLILTKVWFLHVFKRVPAWLQTEIVDSEIDHFLLCFPDLAWEFDPVRENGHLRDFFFDWYKREIELLGKPYSIITGEGEQRINCAMEALAALK